MGVQGLKSFNPQDIGDWYKRVCYQIGSGFDKNPDPGITKLIYQADLEMTPGLFTSIWMVTTINCAVVMLAVSIVLFTAPSALTKSATPIYLYRIDDRNCSSGTGRWLSVFPLRIRLQTRRWTSNASYPMPLHSCQFSQVQVLLLLR